VESPNQFFFACAVGAIALSRRAIPLAWPLPLKARSRASSTSASLTESDTKPFNLRCRRLGRRFDSPLVACCEVVKAILGEGERDERSEGVESECEVRVKASFGGMVIVEIVTQGTLSIFYG
jgi:hypothetical protein